VSQYGDGSCPDICADQWRKARRSHRCCACREEIAPGHRYHRTTFLFDGAWSVYERCERCQAIFEHLSERMAESGDSEEYCAAALNCGHDYEERWRGPPPEAIAALAFWLPGDPIPTVQAKGGG
jgi:hypothetical protein